MNQPLLPGLATTGTTRAASPLPDADATLTANNGGQQLFSDVLVEKIQEVIVDSEGLSQAELIKQLLPEGLPQADAQKLGEQISQLLGPEGQLDAASLQAIIPLLPQGGKELPAATSVVQAPGLQPVVNTGLDTVIRGQLKLPEQTVLPGQVLNGLNKADLSQLVTTPQQLEQTITRFEQVMQGSFFATDERSLVSQIINKFAGQVSGEDKRVTAAEGGRDSAPVIAATDSSGSVRNVNNSAPAAARSEFTLQQPVGKPEWNAELGQRILFMTRNNQQIARINLNPANMGPIEVKLNVQNDVATIMFGASHVQTREALESALPRLREMMAEQGFSSVDVDVSEHPHQQQEGAKSKATAHNGGSDARFDGLDTEPLSVGHVRVSQPDGAIDYFV